MGLATSVDNAHAPAFEPAPDFPSPPGSQAIGVPFFAGPSKACTGARGSGVIGVTVLCRRQEPQRCGAFARLWLRLVGDLVRCSDQRSIRQRGMLRSASLCLWGKDKGEFEGAELGRPPLKSDGCGDRSAKQASAWRMWLLCCRRPAMNHNVVLVLVIGLAGCTSAPSLPNPMSHLSMAATSSTPLPDSIAIEIARPWYHVEGPVSDAKFQEDRNKCASTARQAPAGAGTSERRFLGAFTACMRAEGYAPTPDEDEKARGNSTSP